MAGGQIQVTTNIIGGHQFNDLAKALRGKANGDLRKAMYRNIRKAGRPLVADLRRAALALPESSVATRRDGNSARREIAGSITLQTQATGIRVIANRNKLPADMRGLPHLFERRDGWRHPVHPNPNRPRSEWTWVRQRGRPWFNPTARRHEDSFRSAIIDAMEETASDLRSRG